MLLLSPEKLLVVLAVALVVVGPDRLPRLARQLGGAWRTLQSLRARLEAEAQGVFPEIAQVGTLARAARSPLSYLDRLAAQAAAPDEGEDGRPGAAGTETADRPGAGYRPGDGTGPRDEPDGADLADPVLN